jgi:hypothetical protein
VHESLRLAETAKDPERIGDHRPGQGRFLEDPGDLDQPPVHVMVSLGAVVMFVVVVFVVVMFVVVVFVIVTGENLDAGCGKTAARHGIHHDPDGAGPETLDGGFERRPVHAESDEETQEHVAGYAADLVQVEGLHRLSAPRLRRRAMSEAA